MARHAITVLSLLLATLPLSGCFNSDSDYKAMEERKETLKTQVDAATRENEILTEALDNIKKEQENLNIIVNTARSQITGGSSLAPPVTAPLQPLNGAEAETMNWGGWEWAIPPDVKPEAAVSNDRGGSASTEAAPSAGGRIYRPKPGDVLSTIAARHNTTVSELVRLNPYLQNRRNYMIWESDEILLP